MAALLGATLATPARIFGFDASYVAHDRTIKIVEGSQVAGEAMISAGAAVVLSVGVGDRVAVALPDGTRMTTQVSGIVDLARARSLFASRRGSDLETFIYVPHVIVMDSARFAEWSCRHSSGP